MGIALPLVVSGARPGGKSNLVGQTSGLPVEWVSDPSNPHLPRCQSTESETPSTVRSETFPTGLLSCHAPRPGSCRVLTSIKMRVVLLLFFWLFTGEWLYAELLASNTCAAQETGTTLVPYGSFQMGDALDGLSDAPVHTVYVSGFYMDKYLVTKSLWDSVYHWATNHDYGFDRAGSGKAATHPVQTVDWWDVVKWCNARSEKEGRVAAYYMSAGQTNIYRTGRISVQNDWVKWNAGYRLPTEAEWEKAARGGLFEKRFPWGDTITHSQANYCSFNAYDISRSSFSAYDISQSRGYHPTYNDGVTPYTSPVGSFAANGYGLYDMAGNVVEWCWDWYGSYGSGSQANPQGVLTGSHRVLRGGSWYNYGRDCRSAVRSHRWPGDGYRDVGFRCVLPPSQP